MKLLEKALTGYECAKEVKPKEVKGKGKRSRIAPDPRPAPLVSCFIDHQYYNNVELYLELCFAQQDTSYNHI